MNCLTCDSYASEFSFCVCSAPAYAEGGKDCVDYTPRRETAAAVFSPEAATLRRNYTRGAVESARRAIDEFNNKAMLARRAGQHGLALFYEKRAKHSARRVEQLSRYL